MTARPVLLTPGMAGADGISALSRLVARALAGGPPGETRVLSLADPPRPAGAPEGVRVLGAGGRRPRFVGAVLRQALRSRPGAPVVCVHLHLGPAALALARRHRDLTIFLNGIEAWKPLRWPERLAVRRAGRLLAISEHTRRRFLDAHPGLARHGVQVCHLAVGEASAPGAEAGTDRAPFALIVGRMEAAERYKGHDVLLDVWPSVVARVPGARLVVAGDGSDRPRLEARAAGLDGRVSFLGQVDDGRLERLYADCAFFVMPSREEGFGLVYLEAMRAGRACIGGPGAAEELIEHGVTGLIVDPAEPGEVLGAVVRLFREPATRERMGRAAAARVAREFTEARFRRRLRALLGLEPGP